MKLNIVGDGSFGSFLKELLAIRFELADDADSVILAVPIEAYEEVAAKYSNHHLINVCSVQKPSTDICLKYSERVTSLHPLFGRRTPLEKRNSILCYAPIFQADQIQWDFLQLFKQVSRIEGFLNGKRFTTDMHDQLMAKTHLAAVIAAQQAKIIVSRAKDIPDELIPNSFRLLREFVKTLDDMPAGTMSSILANPYF